MYIYIYIYIYVIYINIYIYMVTYMHIQWGLEIDEFASPNTYHFWGNCESLWPSDSLHFLSTANHFWPIASQF